jgi:phosphoribosyl 1,2-cyclic phosphodiesterase
VEAGDTRLLIDAGFSGRQIRLRLSEIGRAPENLNGILITHEHSDHVQGLVGLCAKQSIPIYCNRLTADAIQEQIETRLDFRIFPTGASFDVGGIGVDTFSVPHDAQDPVGFLLHAAGRRVGFLTDLGHATRLVVERVRSAEALVLETNHDLKLLQEDTKRPWSVKQRILSRHGHLSNESAADVVEQLVSPTLRYLYLGHLSRDCNRPELARKVVADRLQRVGAQHVNVESTFQDGRCPTLTLADG